MIDPWHYRPPPRRDTTDTMRQLTASDPIWPQANGHFLPIFEVHTRCAHQDCRQDLRSLGRDTKLGLLCSNPQTQRQHLCITLSCPAPLGFASSQDHNYTIPSLAWYKDLLGSPSSVSSILVSNYICPSTWTQHHFPVSGHGELEYFIVARPKSALNLSNFLMFHQLLLNLCSLTKLLFLWTFRASELC